MSATEQETEPGKPSLLARWRRMRDTNPRRFTFIALRVATLLALIHYTFGEFIFNPRLGILARKEFWADVPAYLLAPAAFWFAWWLASLRRHNPAQPILFACCLLVIGDAIAFFAYHNLRYYRMRISVDYWQWWTWWLPAIVSLGNAMLLKRWWQLFRPKKQTNVAPLAWWEVLLRCVAVFLASWAVLLTSIHLGVPSMKVSSFTIQVAREFLLQPHWQDDFEFILKNSSCRGKKLRSVLQHVELADLQRKHFYGQLEPAMYQAYVLSPDVDRLPLSELHWRRELWENFYPRVRKEKDPVAAAQIVVRFLRERVGIDPSNNSRVGVETIWIQQMTNEAGFDRIYVAALRSVGIAAKLNANNRAELWTGSEWQEAPRPLITTL